MHSMYEDFQVIHTNDISFTESTQPTIVIESLTSYQSINAHIENLENEINQTKIEKNDFDIITKEIFKKDNIVLPPEEQTKIRTNLLIDYFSNAYDNFIFNETFLIDDVLKNKILDDSAIARKVYLNRENMNDDDKKLESYLNKIDILLDNRFHLLQKYKNEKPSNPELLQQIIEE